MFLVLVCLLLSTRVMAFPPAEAPAVVHFSSLAALAYIYSISWWIRASIHESNFGCCVLVLNYLFINLLAYLFIKIFIYLFVYSVCLCIYLLSLDTQIIWSASVSSPLVHVFDIKFLLFFYVLVRLDISMPYVFKSFIIDDSLLYYFAWINKRASTYSGKQSMSNAGV